MQSARRESSSLEIIIIQKFNNGEEDEDLIKFFEVNEEFQCFVVEKYLLGNSAQGLPAISEKSQESSESNRSLKGTTNPSVSIGD